MLKESMLKNTVKKIFILRAVAAILLIMTAFSVRASWAENGDNSKMLRDFDTLIQTSKSHFDELTPEVLSRSSNQKLLELYSISSETVDYCQSITGNKDKFSDRNLLLKAQQCERVNYRLAKKIEPELRRRSLKYKPIKALLH